MEDPTTTSTMKRLAKPSRLRKKAKVVHFDAESNSTSKRITSYSSFIHQLKKSNILLKIKKGNPVGCSVTLKKIDMNLFFFRLISEILPNINLFEGFYIKFLNNSNSFLFVLNKALFIFELQKYYFL